MPRFSRSSHNAQRSILIGLYQRGPQPLRIQSQALEALRLKGLIARQWPWWLWCLTPQGAALCRELCNPPEVGQGKV